MTTLHFYETRTQACSKTPLMYNSPTFAFWTPEDQMRISRFLLSAALAMAVPVYSSTIIYTATLNGASEDPPTGSPGTGIATLTLNTILETLIVDVTFSGLTGASTAALIHCCTAVAGSGNASVASAVPSLPGFPLGGTSGSFDMTFDLTSPSFYNPAFVTAEGGTPAAAETALTTGLADGLAYFNIHTADFPGGEIRGFFETKSTSSVPEPASALLFGASLLTLILARRLRASL